MKKVYRDLNGVKYSISYCIRIKVKNKKNNKDDLKSVLVSS